MILEITSSNYKEMTFKRKNKVLSLSAISSSIEIEKSTVVVNPLLIFQRMCVSKESVTDMKKYFEYELAPFPLALFSEEGMRKGTKSTLYNAFKPLDAAPHFGENKMYVIDGGYLLHTVVWDRNVSFKNICEQYVNYVKDHYGSNATIIFDGYSDDPAIAGTKSWERLRRSKKQNSNDIIFDIYTISPGPQEKFLGNEHNKKAFIDLLKKELEESSYSVDQAVNDADAVIVTSALEKAAIFDSVIIIAEDIDVLVLLTVAGSNLNNVFFLKPKKGRSPETIYSTSSFKHTETSKKNVLFIHAFSGCDTTSATYNIGKIKFLTTFEKCPELLSGAELFMNRHGDVNLLSYVGERFFIAIYGGEKSEESIDTLRFKRFTKAIVKTTFHLSSLPPTKDAVHHHCMRVYHQMQTWLGEFKDPECWGWKKTSRHFIPIQCTKPVAPPELLKLMFCRCKAKCGKACGCRKAGLKCSPICQHCSGETCENTVDISEFIDNDDIDEDDTEDDAPTLLTDNIDIEHDDLDLSPIDIQVEPDIDIDMDDPEPGPSKKSRLE